MAQIVIMASDRARDVAGPPFCGAALASAIIASAQSRPPIDPGLTLPEEAVVCDTAALEREFALANQGLALWLAQIDRALAAATLGSPLKISAGVVRAAAATLEDAIAHCGALRAAGNPTILIDFSAIRDLVNDRPGLLARTVAAAAMRHASLRAIA